MISKHSQSVVAALAMFAAVPAAMVAALTIAPATAIAQAKNLQCVPYARQLSGVQIYGNAHTWWKQAAGKYARGYRPQAGAVMAFKPHRNSRNGHVAYVAKVVDSRNVLLHHSNWSRINGRRGQIERNVPARDVSPNNDWSEVRVWYHSIQDLGKTRWPLSGFIYNEKPGGRAAASPSNISVPKPNPNHPVREQSSAEFMNAFGGDF